MLTDKQIFDAIKERRGVGLTQAMVDTINAIIYPNGQPGAEAGSVGPLAWGAKVSPAFRDKVRSIAAGLGVDPGDLMACMGKRPQLLTIEKEHGRFRGNGTDPIHAGNRTEHGHDHGRTRCSDGRATA